MNDYDINITIRSVTAKNEQEALKKIESILKCMGKTEYSDNVLLEVNKVGEWIE